MARIRNSSTGFCGASGFFDGDFGDKALRPFFPRVPEDTTWPLAQREKICGQPRARFPRQ